MIPFWVRWVEVAQVLDAGQASDLQEWFAERGIYTRLRAHRQERPGIGTNVGFQVLPDRAPMVHRFSIEEMEKFYLSLWDFCGVIAETRGERVLVDGDRMPGARFFPDARLNYAENLLRRRDDGPALLFRAEDRVRREMSFGFFVRSDGWNGSERTRAEVDLREAEALLDGLRNAPKAASRKKAPAEGRRWKKRRGHDEPSAKTRTP